MLLLTQVFFLYWDVGILLKCKWNPHSFTDSLISFNTELRISSSHIRHPKHGLSIQYNGLLERFEQPHLFSILTDVSMGNKSHSIQFRMSFLFVAAYSMLHRWPLAMFIMCFACHLCFSSVLFFSVACILHHLNFQRQGKHFNERAALRSSTECNVMSSCVTSWGKVILVGNKCTSTPTHRTVLDTFH